MRKHIVSFNTIKKAQAALTTARQKFPKVRASLQTFGKTHSLMCSDRVNESTISQLRAVLA